MATHDPKQCIMDYLSQPLGQLQPSPPPPSEASRTGWRTERRSGGGLGAKAATIQFLQERRLPDRQVYLVAPGTVDLLYQSRRLRGLAVRRWGQYPR